MNKNIIKSLVGAITFLLSLFLMSYFMNRGNADMTMEMGKANLPIIYVNHQGEHINPMHGYVKEVDVSAMNDIVTPFPENRTVSFFIDKFGKQITSISYELRSYDGERLIQNGEIFDYKEADTSIIFDLQIKDLIEENEEYSLEIKLSTPDYNSVKYYTRIIQRKEDHSIEQVRFALDFHQKTFQKNKAKELATYLEPNVTGDNTNYSNVTIHSNLDQVTWGDLEVERISEPEITITEYFSQTMRIAISYFAEITTADGNIQCRVNEYYRLRYGVQRIYLLDYERTTNQLFDMNLAAFHKNKLSLGILDENVNLVESEDGGVFAYINEDRLYSYNANSNRFSEIYAFYDDDNFDKRTYYDQMDIKILNVDESGNIQFMVYGYMNRGIHEGEVGITVYDYNSILNTIEQKVFIPYNKSFARLSSNINVLTYLNNNNELFFYLENAIYCVRLEEKTYDIIVDAIDKAQLKVSKSNRMIVWPTDEEPEKSTSLQLMDLNDKDISKVAAGNNNYIKPLGFMGEDVIYGLVKMKDVVRDNAGSLIAPIFYLGIESQSDKTEKKSYHKDGIYIMDVLIDSNQITMKRVVRDLEDNTMYHAIEDDQIMSNDTEALGENEVEVVVTENLKKFVQIAAKSEFITKSLKFMAPKEVMYEGEREVVLDYPSKKNTFYVYSAKGIVDIYSNEADAINRAEEEALNVINEKGQYIWVRGNKSVSNQIMKMKASEVEEGKTSLAVCLEKILSYEGVSRNCQYLLDTGGTAISILDEGLDDAQILDLTGCSLDAVLYYVNRDIPVLAILDNQTAVVIVGFNELNTVLLDPSTGMVYKKGMKDTENWFKSSQTQFITYIK